MINYNKVLNNLDDLKLIKMKDYLPTYLEENKGKDINLVDSLLLLTQQELEFKEWKSEKMNIQLSAIPSRKTLDDFDFSFQPSINKNLIMELSTLRFIEEKQNVLFVGN